MQHKVKTRGVFAAIAVAALTLAGVVGTAPAANAYEPIPGKEPWLTILSPDGTPRIDPNTGAPQLMPQTGTQLMVQLGDWPDMANTTFTYQWYTVNTTTDVATAITANYANAGVTTYRGINRNVVATADYIGQKLRVTITATHPTLGSGTYTLTSDRAVVGLNHNMTTLPTGTNTTPYTTVFGNPSDSTSPNYLPPSRNWVFFTAYGYPDNTPPSAAISGGKSAAPDTTFPNAPRWNLGIHRQANGDGTYENPLTFATAYLTSAANPGLSLWYGQQIYVPRFERYFVLEDSCGACGRDLTGRTNIDTPEGSLLGPGTYGATGLVHFDVWVDGSDADFAKVIACEDALTFYDSPGVVHMDEIIVNPGPNEKVSPYKPYVAETDQCMPLTDGSDTPWNGADIVGPYSSGGTVPDTMLDQDPQPSGMCITDPGNSTVIGTRVTLEPCDDTRADQNLSHSGMYLLFNNLCLDQSDGMGNRPDSAGEMINGVLAFPVTLQRCNLNRGDQWAVHVDGTITAFNGISASLADLGQSPDGKTYLWATNAGPYAHFYWDNPFTKGFDNTAPVTVSSATVLGEDAIRIKGSGLTTIAANVLLVPTNGPIGVSDLLGTVRANAAGEFDSVFAIPADLVAGSFQVEIQGLSGSNTHNTSDIPVDSSTGETTAITNVLQVRLGTSSPGVGATMNNFRPSDRTVPITGLSDVFYAKADRSTLKTVVEGLSEFDPADFSPASWAKYSAALAAAKATSENTIASPADLNAALQGLTDALNGLWNSADRVLRAGLSSLIAATSKLHESRYVESAWAAFVKAKTAAQAVADNPAATRAEIDTATSALLKAIMELVEKPESPPKVTPGKSVLVKAAQSTVTLVKDKKMKLPAFAYDKNGKATAAKWSVTKGKKVISVSKAGVIKAKKVGTATVTVKSSNGKKTTITVKVIAKKPAKTAKPTVKVKGVAKSLKVGDVAYAAVSFTPKAAPGVVATFSSTAPKVVSVDKAGRVLAKAAGTATLVVKVGKGTKKIKITVS
ncbi:MAG: hypothetical protein FWD59_03695 [Micrococcales bacterium]|nr:hypothetical protein [Micrococcales bacterium]